VFTVNVTHLGAGGISVSFPQSAGQETAAQAEESSADEGPSPIAPELKELLWGFGAFAVFLILMRLWLVPKVKRGMDSRYGVITGQHESAEIRFVDAAGAVDAGGNRGGVARPGGGAVTDAERRARRVCGQFGAG
jgi:hypothetical protein